AGLGENLTDLGASVLRGLRDLRLSWVHRKSRRGVIQFQKLREDLSCNFAGCARLDGEQHRRQRVNREGSRGLVRFAPFRCLDSGGSIRDGSLRQADTQLADQVHHLAPGLVANSTETGEAARGLGRQVLRRKNAEPVESVLRSGADT